MDYEKKIRDYMNSSDIDTLYKSMLNNLFPELAESEGEKIRKALIDYFNNVKKADVWCNGLHPDVILAWLEKQGKKSQRIISAEAKETLYNKPALSEEDEVKINRIVACLENLNVADNDILHKDIDWLKSIKE